MASATPVTVRVNSSSDGKLAPKVSATALGAVNVAAVGLPIPLDTE